MSEHDKPWDEDRIRKGLAHLSEGPDSKMGIYIVQLFQRGVIALEKIAEAGKPVALFKPQDIADVERFHSDGLGMAFTKPTDDLAAIDGDDGGPYVYEGGIKYHRGQNPSAVEARKAWNKP